jgi:hypothetical protein
MIETLVRFFAADAAPCDGGTFLGFAKWYKYLPGKTDSNGLCAPQLSSINDVWLIVAAIVELLLQVAALLAVIMVIYGSVSYMMSRGEPDKTNQARGTLINALVGLAITLIAAAVVNFVAGRIS